MKIYTVSFFGHRVLNDFFEAEKEVEKIVTDLLLNKDYVEFLVGRNGEFDLMVTSTIRRVKERYGTGNCMLILVLPYPCAQVMNNEKNFYSYYDDIEISLKASNAHYKSAITLRNREMIERSDLVVLYMTGRPGGAYNAFKYAKGLNKDIVNIAEDM